MGPGFIPGIAITLPQAGLNSFMPFDRYPAPLRVSQEYSLQMQALGIPVAPLYGSGRITRVARKHFDPRAVSGKFGVILSDAAYKHISDVRITLHQLTTIADPGANLIASIHLQTRKYSSRKYGSTQQLRPSKLAL